jgi:choline dehydrogenase
VQSDEEILAYLRASTGPVHHASATCAMGTTDDVMAVLDSRSKVRGVSNLRVVDASAFPFTPPGHIQASVYMLAEKIADDIRAGR